MAPAEPRLADLARQFAVVFAAIFQVYASYTGGTDVGATAREHGSRILPASYAFSIWAPIFLLCGMYALHQALPAMREYAVYRAMGWWTAGAFLANGAWVYLFTGKQFVLAQIVIVLAFACAAVAYLRFARSAFRSRPPTFEQYIVAPAAGLLAGWLTAASLVGLANTLVTQGFDRTGQGAELRGAALLLLGGAVAFSGIVLAKSGPSAAWIAFAAAVLWALVAIAVEQWPETAVTPAAAAFSAVLVLAGLLGPWGSPPHRDGRGLATG